MPALAMFGRKQRRTEKAKKKIAFREKEDIFFLNILTLSSVWMKRMTENERLL